MGDIPIESLIWQRRGYTEHIITNSIQKGSLPTWWRNDGSRYFPVKENEFRQCDNCGYKKKESGRELCTNCNKTVGSFCFDCHCRFLPPKPSKDKLKSQWYRECDWVCLSCLESAMKMKCGRPVEHIGYAQLGPEPLRIAVDSCDCIFCRFLILLNNWLESLWKKQPQKIDTPDSPYMLEAKKEVEEICRKAREGQWHG